MKTRSKGRFPTNQEESSNQMSDKEITDVLHEEPLTFDIIRKYFDVQFSKVAECTKECIDRFFAKIDKRERESMILNLNLR